MKDRQVGFLKTGARPQQTINILWIKFGFCLTFVKSNDEVNIPVFISDGVTCECVYVCVLSACTQCVCECVCV